MASILITMIMMIIVSLIVLGFGQLSRREQREALDRQLSVAAFYAAESGINDAQNAINSYLTANPGTVPPANSTCSPSSPYITQTTLGSASSGLSYTCLLVNPTPSALSYSPISPNQSQVIYINRKNGASIGQLMFSWQNHGAGNSNFNCSGNNSITFPPQSQWNCGAGVLRMDIAPAGPTDNLNSAPTTYFFHPEQGNSATPSTASVATASGTVMQTNCYSTNTPAQTMPNSCNFCISGLSDTAYYLRVLPIYGQQDLQVSGPSSCSGSFGQEVENFNGDEISIDSTGKANDELRRIQVSYSLIPGGLYPDYAIQSSQSVCKQFSFIPNPFQVTPGPDAKNDNSCNLSAQFSQ